MLVPAGFFFLFMSGCGNRSEAVTTSTSASVSHSESEARVSALQQRISSLEAENAELRNTLTRLNHEQSDALSVDQAVPVRVQTDFAPITLEKPQVRHRSTCESGHWIDSVSDNGDIVKLEDGSVWHVNSSDTIDSSLWLPTSAITVCDGKLINTDDNESVEVSQLR